MTSYGALARNRDFTCLWIGQTVSELGTRVSMFVFPLLAFALTGSVGLAALVEAMHLTGLVGALLPAGVLADRVDRRLLMRATTGAGTLLDASLVVAGALGELTLAHLAVVALLSGVAAGVFSPAELSAVRSVVDEDDLPTALSQNQARQHVAGLVGGPLGGLLYGAVRWLPFAFDAVTYAVSWVMLGRLRTDLSPLPRTTPRASAGADLREGAAFVARHRFFRTLTIWAALTNLTMNALFTVAMLRLVQAGVPSLQLGLVEAAAGAAGIAGALVAPWLIDRLPTGRLTAAIAWSPVPLVVPMAVWGDPAVVAAALGIVLLLNPAGNAGMSAYRLKLTPPALVGRVQSATQFACMATLPLAPLVGGLALSRLGGEAGTLLIGALCGLVAIIPLASRPIRSIPRPSAWPPAAMMEPCPKETASTRSRAGSIASSSDAR